MIKDCKIAYRLYLYDSFRIVEKDFVGLNGETLFENMNDYFKAAYLKFGAAFKIRGYCTEMKLELKRESTNWGN